MNAMKRDEIYEMNETYYYDVFKETTVVIVFPLCSVSTNNVVFEL